jgi:hypothetical protein
MMIFAAAGVWAAPVAQADVWHVDVEVAVAGDGRSWADAFRHLQDALTHNELAAGDEIWVAGGTYHPDRTAANPDGNDRRGATFELVGAVRVYGGFPPGGGDGTFTARDVTAFPTVLSGLIYEPDHYVFDVCGDPPDGAGGCYDETPGSTGCLDGYCCMVVCDNLPFCCVNGWDYQCVEAAAELCSITRSNHVVMAVGGFGGVGPTSQLDGFVITGGSASGWGGGLTTIYNATPTISNCTFAGNAAESGGAVSVHGGIGLTLINCTFVDNEAQVGAAVHVAYGQPDLVNCLFQGNLAHEGLGGGLYAPGTGPVDLVNCTLVDNGADAVHGAASIANSILWANGMPPVSGGGAVTYSCVEGGYDGAGNIDEMPLFADADAGDHRLVFGSPGIDAGSSAALLPDHADLDFDLDFGEPTPLDLDGRGRVLDATVDMGAYELCRRDLDGDGSIGVPDFLVLLSVWGPNPGHVADFDGSGDVGVTDFLTLLSHWGPCR